MANIKVFARLKPCQNMKRQLLKREDHTLFFSSRGQVETHAGSGKICSGDGDSKWLKFRFTHVFETDCSQKNVFEVAARDIVNAFLEGYNGTIFAYGQTGAGKTFTMQGVHDHEDLEDLWNVSENLGVIPQSLSLIFQRVPQFQHDHQESFNLFVSFLEIYKGQAYDLLGPFKGSRKMKELPKVLVTMGVKGSCYLHGLSYHRVTSEKEAARLYHMGIANRQVAEASGNRRSSRSHAIFTLLLSRQTDGAEIFVRSKLHLVDLAGSEQVSKSIGKEWSQLTETRFINLSLHHLESVIIALQEFRVRNLKSTNRKAPKSMNHSSSTVLCRTKNREAVDMLPSGQLKSASAVDLRSLRGRPNDCEPIHIPYKNSILTMVLQDSLGGNCNAAMIAVLSLEPKDLSQTISTCRFAQRVARVRNKPIRNEEVDKDAVIRRLQSKLAELYLELACYEAIERDSIMAHGSRNGYNNRDSQQCVNVVRSFLQRRIRDPVQHGINTPRTFRNALHYMRRLILESSAESADNGSRSGYGHVDNRTNNKQCVNVVQCFLEGRISDPVAHGINTPRKFRNALHYMRELFLESCPQSADSGVPSNSEPTSPLTSEGENDDERFCDGGFAVGTLSSGSESTPPHRSRITQNGEISLNAITERPPEPERLEPSSIDQPFRHGSNEVPTETSPVMASAEDGGSLKGVTADETRVEPVENSRQDGEISLIVETGKQPPERDRLGPSSAAQPLGPGSSDVSTQTSPLIASAEGGESERVVSADESRVQPVENSHGDFRTMELELQKETLLNRSKILVSRLADQRARFVVMLRQGAVPEDLENEKIVELQLQKREREVENKLSLVLMEIADMKYTDQLQRHPHEKDFGIDRQITSCKQGQLTTCPTRANEDEVRPQAIRQTSKLLELKEEATRQKLLARREQMRRNFGLTSLSSPHRKSSDSLSGNCSFSSVTEQADSLGNLSMTSLCEDDKQAFLTPPLTEKRLVPRPPLPRKRIADNSLAVNRTVSHSRGASTLSNQKPNSRKDKSTSARRDAKRSPLVEYLSTSRQSLYLKSTFPRWIVNGSAGNSCNAQKVGMTNRQGTTLGSDETSLLQAKSSTSESLQIHGKSSTKAECVPAN